MSAVLNKIINSKQLEEIDSLLTTEMASQRIQALIKDDNLAAISKTIVGLGKESNENGLVAAAILGRLSAVARGRESMVFSNINSLFVVTPPPIESLKDGDTKYYAALTIANCTQEWVTNYFAEQIVEIDTSEKARKVFVEAVLHKEKNLSALLEIVTEAIKNLNISGSNDTRFRRVRRVSSCLYDSSRDWAGDVGVSIGSGLAELLKRALAGEKRQVDDDVLADILNDTFGILLRVIELRFSNALLAETYDVLKASRISLDNATWSELHRSVPNLERVRTCLKEAALVLARQGKTDRDIMTALSSAYYSRSQVQPAIQAHFSQAAELDPDIREWWERGGTAKARNREVDHDFSNTEDELIGLLLIDAENNEGLTSYINDSVVPLLEIHDSVFADKLQKAMANFNELILTGKQLARMRKLSKMDLHGEVIEYDPIQQELLGGHRLGVRKVIVERDGVQKVFGSKTKIFIKPRVSEIK